MRSILVLSALVALSNGQYNYNAPSGGGGSAGIFQAPGSFGGASGGIQSSGSFGGGSSGIQTSGSFGGGSSGIQSSGSFGGGSSGSGGIQSSGFGSSFTSGSIGGGSIAYANGGSNGYSNGAGSGQYKQQQMISAGYSNQAPIVHKHVYVHVAPEEPEEHIAKAPQALPPPTKHYKIIFVKTPSAPAYVSPVIPAQPQNEEKTLVYVLVKKPDEQPDVVIPTATPTQPSKPEVYFIKYKTQKQSVGGGVATGGISSGGIVDGSGIGATGGVSSGNGIEATGPGISVADLARGGGGAPAPKYGPPGYQS